MLFLPKKGTAAREEVVNEIIDVVHKQAMIPLQERKK
jgi:hypothetical protein